MINAELAFMVKTDWQNTLYEPLKRLALFYKWDKGGIWVFRYSDLKEVEKLLGTIEIAGFRDKFEKEEVFIPEFKGIDFVEIREFPKIYQIVEHRKQDDMSVKEIKHQIPKVLVDTIYKDIIVKLPMNKPIKTSTIAEKICTLLRLDRFFRDSGSFRWEQFFGSRKDYYTYFYLVIKVLVHQGIVIHHKYGAIERIK